MEKRSGSKVLGIAIILLMILGVTKVSAKERRCERKCVGECFDARMIYQCVRECLRHCPPALSKPALNCALVCANSNCKNIASGMQLLSIIL